MIFFKFIALVLASICVLGAIMDAVNQVDFSSFRLFGAFVFYGIIIWLINQR